jgi:nitroreductase
VNVDDAIRGRRSVAMADGDVDASQIRELIELATWAPNHRLTEPWTFTVIAGEERRRLAERWATIAADAQALEGEAREASMQRDIAKVSRAPVLVVVSTRVDPDPVVADEDFAATAAAVQNLLLGAYAHGIGAMWRTGRMTRDPAIKEHLGLDPADRIVAIVYLGRPAARTVPGRPREVDARIRWLGTSPPSFDSAR